MAEPITNVLGTVAIKHCGGYDATMHYEKLNVVTYNGSSYCAKDNTVGNLPTNTTYWDLMAEKGDKGDTGDDGYTPVKGTDYYTDADKAELESTLASDVSDEVTDQLGALTSATPLAAASTAGMTDTTRVYVNTTDGHWYWYNGAAWTDGGVYQSTSDHNDVVNLKKGILNFSEYGEDYEDTDILSLIEYGKNIRVSSGNIVRENNKPARARVDTYKPFMNDFVITPKTGFSVLVIRTTDGGVTGTSTNALVGATKFSLSNSEEICIQMMKADSSNFDGTEIPFSLNYSIKIDDLEEIKTDVAFLNNTASFVNYGKKFTDEDILNDILYGKNAYLSDGGTIVHQNNSARAIVDLFKPTRYSKFTITPKSGFNIAVTQSVDQTTGTSVQNRNGTTGLTTYPVDILTDGSYYYIIQCSKTDASNFDGTEIPFDLTYENIIPDLEELKAEDNKFRSDAYLQHIYTDVYDSSHVMQGGCTDGDNIYMCYYANHLLKKYNISSKEVIVKDYSSQSVHGHANDMTYNQLTNKIYISTMFETGEISIVNPETLEKENSVYLTINGEPLLNYAIAYDRVNNQYVVGIENSYNFAIFDSSFNYVSTITIDDYHTYTKQGIETDGTYIYRALHNRECIEIYDFDGNLIGTSFIPNSEETEAIMTDYEGNFYLLTNISGAGAGIYYIGLNNKLTYESLYGFINFILKDKNLINEV